MRGAEPDPGVVDRPADVPLPFGEPVELARLQPRHRSHEDGEDHQPRIQRPRCVTAAVVAGLEDSGGGPGPGGAGVLVVDETGFAKKGRASAGVARQFTGTLGACN
ncbi:hypothetical protein GCM10018966_093180 [Streptomyces yanii]